MKYILLILTLALCGCTTKFVGLTKLPPETTGYTFIRNGITGDITAVQRFGGKEIPLTKSQLQKANKMSHYGAEAYVKWIEKQQNKLKEIQG